MDIDNSDLDAILNRFRTMNTNDKDYLITEFKRLSNTQLSNEGCCFYLDLAEWNLNTALWAYYEYENAAITSANSANLANSALNPYQQSSSETNNTITTNTNNNNNSNNMQQLENIYHNYSEELPEMQFLCDVTIGEGESVHPNTTFIKTWRIKNSGNRKWPSDCRLKYVNGYNFTASSYHHHQHHSSSYSSNSSTSSLTSDSSSNNHNNTTTSSTINSNELILVGPNGDTPVSIEVRELEPHEVCDISISLKSPKQCGIYQCQYRMFTSLNQPFGDPIWLLLNVEEGGVLGITQQLNSVSMFGNWNQNNSNNNNQNLSNQATGSTNENNSNIFSKSPFKLDNNYNYINTNNQNNNLNMTNEEKRPDFYDDMFS